MWPDLNSGLNVIVQKKKKKFSLHYEAFAKESSVYYAEMLIHNANLC